MRSVSQQRRRQGEGPWANTTGADHVPGAYPMPTHAILSDNPRRQVLPLPPSYRSKTRDIEKLRNLPKITGLLSSRLRSELCQSGSEVQAWPSVSCFPKAGREEVATNREKPVLWLKWGGGVTRDEAAGTCSALVPKASKSIYECHTPSKGCVKRLSEFKARGRGPDQICDFKERRRWLLAPGERLYLPDRLAPLYLKSSLQCRWEKTQCSELGHTGSVHLLSAWPPVSSRTCTDPAIFLMPVLEANRIH